MLVRVPELLGVPVLLAVAEELGVFEGEFVVELVVVLFYATRPTAGKGGCFKDRDLCRLSFMMNCGSQAGPTGTHNSESHESLPAPRI